MKKYKIPETTCLQVKPHNVICASGSATAPGQFGTMDYSSSELFI